MKAFPHVAKVHMLDGNSMVKEEITSGGMDLRDYFAAKVMHYWLCNPIDNIQIEKLCKGAYQVADAMMKAREL